MLPIQRPSPAHRPNAGWAEHRAHWVHRPRTRAQVHPKVCSWQNSGSARPARLASPKGRPVTARWRPGPGAFRIRENSTLASTFGLCPQSLLRGPWDVHGAGGGRSGSEGWLFLPRARLDASHVCVRNMKISKTRALRVPHTAFLSPAAGLHLDPCIGFF